jgi:hypothetical protein
MATSATTDDQKPAVVVAPAPIVESAPSSATIATGGSVSSSAAPTTLGAASVIAASATTDDQKPAAVVAPAPVLKNAAPPAPPAAGRSVSHFVAASIPPRDPEASILGSSAAATTSLGPVISVDAPRPLIRFVAAAAYSSSGEDDGKALDRTELADAGADLIDPPFDAGAIILASCDAVAPGAVEQVVWSIAPNGDGDGASGIAAARPSGSSDDVIRAIRASEIVVKVADLSGASAMNGRTWLFDEAQGAFVDRDPEHLTIVIDNRAAGATPQPVDPVGLAASAVATLSESSWLAALRQLGRVAAAKWFSL